MKFPFQTVQQDGNWYVLDEEFPWDVGQLKRDAAALTNIGIGAEAIIFCDTCDANRVLSALGEEEEEFLFPVHGFYQPSRRLIFVCVWEEYERVLETLLHELRHSLQYEDEQMRWLFSQTASPYHERWIEVDAREFASQKIREYQRQKGDLSSR